MRGAKPVIATRVGGTLAVVEDGVTGILVDVGRPAEIADRLRELMRSPDRRREMGRAGQERARARFGGERYVREVESLYRELLARKGAIR